MTDLELCGYCVATVEAGAGEPWRVDALRRKYRGAIVVFLGEVITTFRPCAGCGEANGNVRYAATTTQEAQ